MIVVPPVKVVINGLAEYAVRPVVISVTEMGLYVAPTGTVTLSEVEVAADTFAIVAPKNTILLEGVVLKLVPVITTVVPTAPEVGVKEVIA